MALHSASMATLLPLQQTNSCSRRVPHSMVKISSLPIRKYNRSPGSIQPRASVATKPSKSPAEEDWKVKREYLLKNQVRSVNATEAYRMVKEDGFIVLDVRPEGDFKEIHPEGAVNAQVYRLIKEWTAWDIARRAAFAFFGIFQGTEENPEFLNDVRSQLDKDSRIIVACAAGGTMKPSANLADGQQSRSLIAAYLLKLDGYKNVVHLEGGLRSWFNEDLPTSSSETS
ncbi:hypothetical protein KP509_11G085200 [Ceratopteris richardii]|nr:hypothetical protein KP509_11G085200 [Ceratopteris richardii]